VPRHKLVSDAELLDVAVRLIGERGPDGFTLAQLGARVGLAPATLLQRFASKNQLIEAAIGHANARLGRAVARVPVPAADAEAALVAWLVELAAPFRTRELIASHMVFLRRDLLEPELRAKAKRHSNLVRRRVRQYLEALDPDAVARAAPIALVLEAQWHGLVIQWAIAGRGSLEAWLRAGLTRVVRALRGRTLRR
jgi:AcrR family transcriptional regulator